MKYYIGFDKITKEIKHVVEAGGDWDVQRQSKRDGLQYAKVSKIEYEEAYPFPALFKWDNGTRKVIANDLFPKEITEIKLPEDIAFFTRAATPDHVTIKRKKSGIVLKAAIK